MSVDWFSMIDSSGGYSAYAFIDAATYLQEAELRELLRRQNIAFRDYATGFGASGGQRRPVIRVEADEWERLKGVGIGFSSGGPRDPLPHRADWINVIDSHGATSAYAYVDAITRVEEDKLRAFLNKNAVPFRDYQTGLGAAQGQRRSVIRVDADALARLVGTGVEVRGTEPPKPLALRPARSNLPDGELLELVGARAMAGRVRKLGTNKGPGLLFEGVPSELQPLQMVLAKYGVNSIQEDADGTFGQGLRIRAAFLPQFVGVLSNSGIRSPYQITIEGALKAKLFEDEIRQISTNKGPGFMIEGQAAELAWFQQQFMNSGIDATLETQNGDWGAGLRIRSSSMALFGVVIDRLQKEIAGVARPSPRPQGPQYDALEQSRTFNRVHRIEAQEKILFGYKDGGRYVQFDDKGKPLNRPNREFLIVKSPQDDPTLGRVIEQAKANTSKMTTIAEKTIFLKDYINHMMPDWDHTDERLGEIANSRDFAGAEISLGQMIDAKTGVCRHRALLFKVLADACDVPAAMVRGNYIGMNGSGGHLWNEVILENGGRVLVDVMHNFIGDASCEKVRHYADVDDGYLYRAQNNNPLAVVAGGPNRGGPYPSSSTHYRC